MKNVILLFVISLLIFSCKKNSNDPRNPNNSGNGGILIKGKIPVTASVNANSLKSGSALTLADAKKVLIFSGTRYNLVEIVNGSFTAFGQMGNATALVFLDANNKYIGNLFVGGLNVLPLDSLKNGKNTIIDLSTLTLSGNSVIPAHNPLGDEIWITAAGINCLKEVSGYYESLAKNIDADNDGIPDILSNKQININTMFAISVGKWGINSTLPIVADIANFYINYTVNITGGSGFTIPGGNIALSGPAGSPYTDISLHGSMMNNGFMATFKRETPAPAAAPWGSTFLPIKGGIYTLTLNGNQSYTVNYSNIGVKANLALVVPTLHTNSDGKLTSISFEYKLPNGTKVNPYNILTGVCMQLNTSSHVFIYDTCSDRLTSKTGFASYTLKTPLDISALWQLDIFYDDILGNTYNIIWH